MWTFAGKSMFLNCTSPENEQIISMPLMSEKRSQKVILYILSVGLQPRSGTRDNAEYKAADGKIYQCEF